MATSSRKLELERKRQRLAEMRSTTVEIGRPSLPPSFLNQEVNDLLDAVGISLIDKQLDFKDASVNNEQLRDGENKPPTSDETKSLLKLDRCEIQQISVLPKEIMCFDKHIQTDEIEPIPKTPLESEEFDKVHQNEKSSSRKVSPRRDVSMPFAECFVEASKIEEEPVVAPKVEINEQDKNLILSSLEFGKFFQKASKIVERALNEEVDILIDYTSESSAEKNLLEIGELLNFKRVLTNPKSCENRMISAMDFSLFYPDLLAVAYGAITNSKLEEPGVIHLWSTRNKTLECTFLSRSKITSMQFAHFHSNVIIGGCYSGQICMWDNRVNKKSPVLKSTLSAASHTQPIYSMNMIGSQNANELVTVSTDGKMCIWSIDNLTVPIEVSLLNCKNKRQLPIYNVSFFHNTTNFCAGGEDGALYLGDRHGNKDEVTMFSQAHFGPISTVEMHRTPGKVIDFSRCCLSSSMDGTIKLWDFNYTNPVFSFDQHKNYILDAKWSPTHPAVFISGDMDGIIHLWNLNSDTDTPIFSIEMTDKFPAKLIWSRDGKQLVVGDSSGQISLYEVHEDMYNVQPDEWNKMTKLMHEVRSPKNVEKKVG